METLNNLYKRYEGLVKLIIMVAPLIFAGWTYLHKFIDVPERMDRFEARAKRDSVYYFKIIKENRVLDSLQTIFLESDYTDIQKLKTQSHEHHQ